MGFLDFLKGGGGGIVSSVLGGGMGLIGSAINAKTPKEMQEASFEYGREMMEKRIMSLALLYLRKKLIT